MQKTLHRAAGRGGGDYGWLKTRYSFSFSSWYDASRMGFGALRVLNDDWIAPASGFPMHGHRDMEIVTVVTSGTLTHKDSLGNTGAVREGEVQVMSAGTGIVHSEYNASEFEPLTLFQIWIETAKPGSQPRYAQKSFGNPPSGEPMLLVGPEGAAELTIGQDAFISNLFVESGGRATYALKRGSHGLYAFLVEGRATIAGETLGARDAIGITGAGQVEIVARETARVLLIEVPLTH